MKYKNIHSAIHNLGHSFFSFMNYVDGTYIIDELINIRSRGFDIEIDWLNNTFIPKAELTSNITKSITFYAENLTGHMHAQDIDVTRIQGLKLCWPANGKRYMWAKDDRGKEYKINVSL